jgi:hypothetical protein
MMGLFVAALRASIYPLPSSLPYPVFRLRSIFTFPLSRNCTEVGSGLQHYSIPLDSPDSLFGSHFPCEHGPTPQDSETDQRVSLCMARRDPLFL